VHPLSAGNRTDEERQRARAEREGRRAAATEQPPPPAERPPVGPSAATAQAPPLRPSALAPVAALPAGARGRRRPALIGAGALLLAIAALVALAVVLAERSKPKPKPVAPIAVVRITIPEGETRVQIARIAAAKSLQGSYLANSRRSALLDPAHYGAPRDTPNLEGFLFPATYELYAGEPARRLVAEQLAAFREDVAAVAARGARSLHITPYQLLIVASMVEREALLASDRPKVAAVIYNRLRLGMALGIDSTIRYALNDFSKPLTEAQLHIDSPYNTRAHRGLPPTPISNPGLAAIAAAAHPAHVPYLYYVNGADGCGELAFSTEYAQFERDAAAYRAALAANGGRVPTCRKHQ
jgi:hypothetical protein